jgi:hypothetical protein
MSDVTRNGVFLARALGDKSICELLSPQGRFCSTCLSEPVQPRKADGGSQSLLVYWASREANLIQRQNAFFPSRERIY